MRIEKLLRLVIIFWGMYFLLEAGLFLFDVRLTGVKDIWSISAYFYAQLIGKILGSAFLFMGILAFMIQKNLEKYKFLIGISGLWAIFHGLLLIYLSITNNYSQIFTLSPSLFVWLPAYNFYLLFEGAVIIIYGIMVYLWIKK